MKIALCYFSASGNTELACKYLQRQIPEIDLIDITKTEIIDVNSYDILGCASGTYYLTLPPVLNNFINSLDSVIGKPVFLLFTYSVMPGKTVKHTAKLLENKGYKIIEYYTLQMPESFPPYIKKGVTCIDSPKEKEQNNFKGFIRDLRSITSSIPEKSILQKKKIQLGFWNSIIPVPSEKKIKKAFGILLINSDKCANCGTCKKACIYNAISNNLNPVFNMENCRYCYNCYNKCPNNAIHTTKLKENWQYRGPNKKIKEKIL